MRCILGAAALPTAPVLLPEVSPDQPAALRDEVTRLRTLARRALRDLPDAHVTVLVAAGPRGIYDSACAGLVPLGVPGVECELPVAVPLLEHLSRLTQYPMFRGDDLDTAHAVLVHHLRAVKGIVPVLPLNVPPSTDFDVLVAVGASIAEAVQDADLTASVVVSGDLSAALTDRSPRHVVEGAADFDRAVVEAFEAADLKQLRDLGPDEAARVHASGWAPLAVLHGVCAAGRLTPILDGYHAPAGVGQVVARCLESTTQSGRYDRVEGSREGVVPRTGDARG